MSTTSFKFKGAQVNDGWVSLLFEGTHSIPGCEGTTLRFDVRVETNGVEVRSEVNLGRADATTIREALDKMGDWLTRAGEAIKTRRTPTHSIPLYTGNE